MSQLQEAKLQLENAITFILAGNATFTLRSAKTGARYTYKVRKNEDKPGVWFVGYLTGSDNESDFTPLANIRDRKVRLNSKMKNFEKSAPWVALNWFLTNLFANITPGNIEIFHAGRCGRCGRKLTVPESVTDGFGPECIGKVA
jgi:hypothetical protein